MSKRLRETRGRISLREETDSSNVSEEHLPTLIEIPTGINTLQAIAAIFKCVVGVGSFFLPFAIKQSGLYGGIIGIILLVGVTVYLNNIIISTKNKVFPNQPSSYVDLTREVYGPWTGHLMYLSIVIGCIGTCSIYLVTCGELLNSVNSNYSMIMYAIIVAIGETLVSWLPSFYYFAYTSIIGNVCLFLAMTIVVFFGFSKIGFLGLPSAYPPLVLETLPQFFSLAAFLFIQPPTLFPIANAMKYPENFNWASTLAYGIIALVNTVFGVVVYMFFGSETQDIVLKNLCPTNTCDSSFVVIAQLALVLDVFFTFPVIFTCATDILENSFLGKGEFVEYYEKMYLRTAVIGLILALALFIPNISDL